MKKLKRLKLIGGLEPSQILNFNNYNNIEYLYLDININSKNSDLFKNKIFNYFINYQKLKSLNLKKNISFIKFDKFYNFNFPIKLNSLNLINIDGNSLINILNNNNKLIINIKELKIQNILFNLNEFNNLINLLINFKSLLKLSINKIIIANKLYQNLECSHISIFEYITKIIKNIPDLIELDVSNNNYEKSFFEKFDFNNIKINMPKKLLCLKIFNDNIPIKLSILKKLVEVFGYVLDLNNNYLTINDENDENIKKNKIFKSNNLECNFNEVNNDNEEINYIHFNKNFA